MQLTLSEAPGWCQTVHVSFVDSDDDDSTLVYVRIRVGQNKLVKFKFIVWKGWEHASLVLAALRSPTWVNNWYTRLFVSENFLYPLPRSVIHDPRVSWFSVPDGWDHHKVDDWTYHPFEVEKHFIPRIYSPDFYWPPFESPFATGGLQDIQKKLHDLGPMMRDRSPLPLSIKEICLRPHKPRFYIPRWIYTPPDGTFTSPMAWTTDILVNGVPCHRSFLAARSLHLSSVLSLGYADTTATTLTLPYSAEVLTVLLHFLYMGTAGDMLTPLNAVAVLLAAAEMGIATLRAMAENVVLENISVQNVCEVAQVAFYIDSIHLVDACAWFIAYHVRAVLRTRGWRALEPVVRAYLVAYMYRNQ